MIDRPQHTVDPPHPGAGSYSGSYLAAAAAVLARISTTQMEAIGAAAELCARAIGAGGFAHLFGTGHSRIPLEEAFPRYGSFPGFHPIAELSMTFHTQVTGANGQRQAMFIERVEGLAEVILSNFHLLPTDVMAVFSHGGVTAVPVEMAMAARRRGLPVIAVTAVEQCLASTPGHSSGTRLVEHADIVIDLCTPLGDAMVTIDGVDTPVGPGSTIANAAVVNEIKVQTAALLAGEGLLPPVLTSSCLVGEQRSIEIFEAAYDDHAHRLARALGGDA